MGSTSFILDCDGVILDSNNLKLSVVREVLLEMHEIFPKNKIKEAVTDFQNNFGKSRYWHVKNMEKLIPGSKKGFSERFVTRYSEILKPKYLQSNLCKGVENFLMTTSNQKFVVSGSNEEELREVFRKKDLQKYFMKILGSPKTKSENIAAIIEGFKGDFIYIGDSVEDFKASEENNIEFIFLKQYSLVPQKLMKLSMIKGFKVCESWSQFSHNG